MELGIPYEFLAVDGSRFVVGNSATAKADADFVGYLDPENAITGLLDGPDDRVNTVPLVQADGADIGPGYSGGRTGTVNGMLNPNVAIATRESYERKVQAVLHAGRRADILMTWQPSDGSPARMLRVRRAARPDFRGRQPRTFALTLASRDPVILSRDESSIMVGPFNGALSKGAGVATPHLGNAPAWPRFYVEGQITNPVFYLYNSSGVVAQIMQYTGVISATQRLIVLPELKRAILGTKLIEAGFEQSLVGWSAAPNTYNNAPNSFTWGVGAPVHGGGARGDIVTGASPAFTGVWATIPGPFYRGRQYLFRVWARSTTAQPVHAIVSDAIAGVGPAVGANVMLGSGVYVPVDALWTPTFDVATALLTVRSPVAGAFTWTIDDGSFKQVGKAYDYMWAITNPVDVSGALSGTMVQLAPGTNGELVIGCAGSGSESYVRMIYNAAFA